MLGAAYDVAKDAKFLKLQRTAFDWLLGANDLHIPLYDFRTKGCSDGLMPGGVNGNQGAESTLSYLLSLLAVSESYALIDKTQAPRDSARPTAELLSQIADDAAGTQAPAEEEDAAESQISKPT